MRCSSVMSSGVKISSGVRSSTRKLPPLAATMGLCISGARRASVAIFSFSFVRCCELHALENAGRAHAPAHAHRDQAIARLAAVHLAHHLRGQLGAGGTEWMAQSDRAAVDVHLR